MLQLLLDLSIQLFKQEVIMKTFTGEAYVIKDDKLLPVVELIALRKRLLDETIDEVEALFLANCSLEELLQYTGEAV